MAAPPEKPGKSTIREGTSWMQNVINAENLEFLLTKNSPVEIFSTPCILSWSLGRAEQFAYHPPYRGLLLVSDDPTMVHCKRRRSTLKQSLLFSIIILCPPYFIPTWIHVSSSVFCTLPSSSVFSIKLWVLYIKSSTRWWTRCLHPNVPIEDRMKVLHHV